MVVTNYPIPYRWRKNFRGLTVIQVLLPVCLFSLAIFLGLRCGIYDFILLGTFSTIFALMVASAWRGRSLAVAKRVSGDGVRVVDGALAISVDARLWSLHLATGISGIAAAAVMVLCQVYGLIDYDPEMYGMGLVGVVGGIHQLVRILRLGSRDVLVVSTRGVVARPLESRPIHIDWGEITEAVPCRRTAGRTRVALGFGPAATRFEVDHLATGSPAAFWLLDFYARHPSLRDELGDVRVLRRLRDGSFIETPCRHV